MCEIGSLRELATSGMKHKTKWKHHEKKKNNRQRCVGRSEHVSKTRERLVRLDSKTVKTWPGTTNVANVQHDLHVFTVDRHRVQVMFWRFYCATICDRFLWAHTFGCCVKNTLLLWVKMYFHLSTDFEMRKTGTFQTERWQNVIIFFCWMWPSYVYVWYCITTWFNWICGYFKRENSLQLTIFVYFSWATLKISRQSSSSNGNSPIPWQIGIGCSRFFRAKRS